MLQPRLSVNTLIESSCMGGFVPPSPTHAHTHSHTHTHAHRLRDSVCGYWPFVVYFTRSEAVQYLSSLSNVHLDIGRGVCVCVPPYLTLPCKDGPGCVCVCVSHLTLPCLAGRAWLCTALNEQALESYVRMVVDNQDVVKGYYLQ